MRQFHKGREPLRSVWIEMPFAKQYTSDSEIYTVQVQNTPNHGERERRIDVHEYRSDFILVMEYKTIPPCDDSAGE